MTISRQDKFLPVIFILQIFLFTACQPFATQFEDIEEGEIYTSASIETPPASVESILVMTWNIRFGAGRVKWFGDSCGDRVILSSDEVYSSLDRIAEVINNAKPDIILLQEVDRNSKKSAYIDQLKWILNNTHLNYGSFAFTWKSDFVPSDGLGRCYEGNAILSRWKINDTKRIQLPRREDQDDLTRYFYVQPNILKSKIELPGLDNLYIMNVHLSAFSTDDTKKKQVNKLTEELNKLNNSGNYFVVGGDFNLLPPNSDSTDYCFEDKCDDESFHHPGDDPFHKEGSNYTPEITWLQPIYNSYNPSVTLTKYAENQEKYFTHTTRFHSPFDRKLDYLFTNLTWIDGSEIIHHEVIEYSDHAALSAILEVPR